MVPFTFSSKQRHYLALTICAFVGLASLVSLVYGVVRLQKSYSSTDDDLRSKRSASVLKNNQESLFRPALHKVNSRKFAGLDDVFISVKTSKKFHSTRLKIILETWFNLAPNKVIHFRQRNVIFKRILKGYCADDCHTNFSRFG